MEPGRRLAGRARKLLAPARYQLAAAGRVIDIEELPFIRGVKIAVKIRVPTLSPRRRSRR